MTKTLKDLFEVYKPKSPDEQKFVDKHVTIKHKDRNGNDDDVFKGNTKYIKRKEERHGYDVGDDEKVYEEVEEIEELSQKMVRAYRDKARDDKDNAEDDREFYKAHDDNTDAEDKKIRKRTAGIKMASKKIHGGAKVGVKEEAELKEKKLTPAEMKKREEVAKAIERENPKMPMSKKMAIATATAKKVAEEVEELDESAKVAAHLIKRYGENVRKSHVRSAANDFGVGYVALSHAVRKKLGVNRLEEEQIDEISTKLALDYTDKASDARGHRNLSTPKLDKRYKSMALAHEKIRARHAKVPTTEEVEQIDELSPQTMARYHKAAGKDNEQNKRSREFWRSEVERSADSGQKDSHSEKQYQNLNRKIRNRAAGQARAIDKIANEDVQIDELSKKTLGSYTYKATNQVGEKGLTAGLKIQNNEPVGKELKTMGKRQRGVAMAVKKLTKEEIINRAIDKYMPELEDYVPMTQEEKLIAKLEHLPEAHVLMILGLYENLNEDNRIKMMSAVDTPEGINSLIDFAIQNRGE